MAARFSSANSQRLRNASPAVSTYPITVGIWAFPATASGTKPVWSLADTATNNNYVFLFQSSALWSVNASGASNNVAGLVAGQWQFLLLRLISSTNRRLSVIAPSGEITHAAGINAVSPSGIDVMNIGAHERDTGSLISYFDGLLAEFWLTNTDIQADGAQVQTSTLLQLAYGGPFSVPHIVKNILEYRSFRKYPSSESDESEEVYHGPAGRQIWSNINGVTTGPHPPLPYWYGRPGDSSRLMVAQKV